MRMKNFDFCLFILMGKMINLIFNIYVFLSIKLNCSFNRNIDLYFNFNFNLHNLKSYFSKVFYHNIFKKPFFKNNINLIVNQFFNLIQSINIDL